MNAEIDEGSEVCHVGDDAFEFEADAHILHFLDVFAEGGVGELGAGVTTGFLQFGDDVAQGRFADRIRDVGFNIRFELFGDFGGFADADF